MNELALTESPSLRAEYVDHVEVLDKVKRLVMLPDGMHVTTEMVANYYEVGVDAVESVVRRNRTELDSNGYVVLRGADLREFETVNLTGSKRRALALFTRRAILNVGQMLAESTVARAVRRYLLDVEERTRQIHLAGGIESRPVEPYEPKTFPMVDVMVLIWQQFGVRIPIEDFNATLRAGGVLRQDGRPMAVYGHLFWLKTKTRTYEAFEHSVTPLYRLYESTKIRMEIATQTLMALDPPGWPELPLGGDS